MRIGTIDKRETLRKLAYETRSLRLGNFYDIQQTLTGGDYEGELNKFEFDSTSSGEDYEAPRSVGPSPSSSM